MPFGICLYFFYYKLFILFAHFFYLHVNIALIIYVKAINPLSGYIYCNAFPISFHFIFHFA